MRVAVKTFLLPQLFGPGAKSAGNLEGFQGFSTKHGGKKTRNNVKVI